MSTVLQIKPLWKVEGELLDVYAKVRGTIGCKKRLMEATRQDAEQYAKWDIDVGAASGCADICAAEGWRETVSESFSQYHISCAPLTFSISSHVGRTHYGYGCNSQTGPCKEEGS
ncbi:MAG: DegV family protein [Dysosmobacter sp.]